MSVKPTKRGVVLSFEGKDVASNAALDEVARCSTEPGAKEADEVILLRIGENLSDVA